jgi:hypothetical protein
MWRRSAQLRDHLRETGRLPGITDDPMGVFARGDVLLEKLEEAYLYSSTCMIASSG